MDAATSGASASRSDRIQPRGGTALYDTVAEAVHMAQQGRNRKKAVVIISDGNDTSSHTDVFARQAVDSRDRSARLRDRHRLGGTTSYITATSSQQPQRRSTAAAHADARSHSRARRPCRSRRRRSRRRDQAAAATRAGAVTACDDRVNVAALARHHRRQRRPHRDHPVGARSRSGNGRHRGRIEQAVLHRVLRPPVRRTADGTRFASTCARPRITCARGGATSRRSNRVGGSQFGGSQLGVCRSRFGVPNARSVILAPLVHILSVAVSLQHPRLARRRHRRLYIPAVSATPSACGWCRG